jgi:transcription antitermination factor NusG
MDWYVWTINQQRYHKVIELLDELDEVVEYLYPTVVREYDTKAGKKTKDVPLYSNYVFIKCEHSNKLHSTLSKSPWIHQYLGRCPEKDIESVRKMSTKKYEDLLPTSGVVVGHVYKLKGTPFKEMNCTVVSIDGDNVTVAVELFGSDRMIKCLVDDIDLEG